MTAILIALCVVIAAFAWYTRVLYRRLTQAHEFAARLQRALRLAREDARTAPIITNTDKERDRLLSWLRSFERPSP